MSKLKLKNIHKSFDKTPVISGVDLDIADKEFLVLVGPSGCGKSTLLRIIAGLEGLDSGEVCIGDDDVTDAHPKDRDVAFVFQNYALYPHMSVFDNMAFGLKMRKAAKAEIEQKVEDAACILGLQDLLDRKPAQLSGGQRQRVALGRAIVRSPKVFLMDEPLSNLDAKLRSTMRFEIKKLHQKLDTTFVYVTHDQTEAMTMGDRIAVVHKGEIQQIGTAQDVYDEPQSVFVAGFLGSPSMNFIDGSIKEGSFIIGTKKIKLEENLPDRKDVILGIRPESLELVDDSIYDSDFVCDVELVEMLGSESLVHFVFQGFKLIAKIPASKADGRQGLKQRAGSAQKVGFSIAGRVFLFDKNTQKRI